MQPLARTCIERGTGRETLTGQKSQNKLKIYPHWQAARTKRFIFYISSWSALSLFVQALVQHKPRIPANPTLRGGSQDRRVFQLPRR